MQKIAILGGTFNPIHNGHLHLIKRFSEKIGFDRVILIPTKVPTHKGEEHLADAVHRVRMCRLAAKEFGYEVSDMEVLPVTNAAVGNMLNGFLLHSIEGEMSVFYFRLAEAYTSLKVSVYLHHAFSADKFSKADHNLHNRNNEAIHYIHLFGVIPTFGTLTRGE